MNVRSFKFYDNYYLLLTLLNGRDREIMADSILKYMFEGIEPNFEISSKSYAIWTNMKIALDKQQTNSINGQKGGAPKGNNNAKKTSETTTQKTTEKQPKVQANEQPKKQPNNILYLLFNNFYFQDKGLLREKITEWISYKRERKESYKERGFKSLLTQIEKNCTKYGEEAIINLINECMASNYSGIIFDKLKSIKPITNPEWFKKEVKKEEISSEELDEVEEILKEFK